MARLTAAQRRRIPLSKFGVPSKAPGPGSYPMNDREHAVLAEGRSARKPVHARIVAKAKRLYPGLGKSRKPGGFQQTMESMRPSRRRRG